MEISNEDARRKAAEMIDRIRRGLDPVPPPKPTVADLAERYMTAHVEVNCRPGTVEQYRSLLTLHILPELGALRLSEVNRPHASALHYRLRGTRMPNPGSSLSQNTLLPRSTVRPSIVLLFSLTVPKAASPAPEFRCRHDSKSVFNWKSPGIRMAGPSAPGRVLPGRYRESP